MASNKIPLLTAVATGVDGEASYLRGASEFFFVVDATALVANAGFTLQDSADGVSFADVIPAGEAAAAVTVAGKYLYPYVRPYVRAQSDGVSAAATVVGEVNTFGDVGVTAEFPSQGSIAATVQRFFDLGFTKS